MRLRERAREAAAWLLWAAVGAVMGRFERRTQAPVPSDWHAIAEHEIENDIEIKRERAGGWP